MRKKTTKAPQAISRERLNELMDAIALVIARRQMKRYWAPIHTTTLSSVL